MSVDPWGVGNGVVLAVDGVLLLFGEAVAGAWEVVDEKRVFHCFLLLAGGGLLRSTRDGTLPVADGYLSFVVRVTSAEGSSEVEF
jgi:hypothetical protein